MAEDDNEAGDKDGAETKEPTMEDKIALLSGQGTRQLVLAVVLLILMPVLFVVCILSLASAVKTTDRLFAIEPVNRAGILSKEIDKVKKNIENQYAEHLVKMEDQTIFTVSDKFTTLYSVSQQSESDYGKLLLAYQQAVYQTASNVRGSGEWYF